VGPIRALFFNLSPCIGEPMTEKLETLVIQFILFIVAVLIVSGVWWTLSRMYFSASHSEPPADLTAYEQAQLRNQMIQLENQARSGLVLAFCGAAVILIVMFPMRRFEALSRTVDLALQRQGTETYGRALEQLGRDSMTQRIGAIYALERIARTGPDDHGPIMEVLAAFIRDHGSQDHAGGARAYQVRPDVQAALRVIGRRRLANEVEGSLNLNLRGSYLVKADLNRAQLKGVDLSGSILDFADLSYACLDGARLSLATLKNSDLNHASLHRADLSGADLSHAHSVAKKQFAAARTDGRTVPPVSMIDA